MSELNSGTASADNDFILFPAAVSGEEELISGLIKLNSYNMFNSVNKSDENESGFLIDNAEDISAVISSELALMHSIKSIAGYKIDIKLKNLIGYIALYSGDIINRDDLDLLKTISENVANTVRNNEVIKALKESENNFRQIYENMSIGVAKISMDFRVCNANEAYCSMLGYREEELIGKHLRDITAPEVIDENMQKQQALARGLIDHFRMEKIFINKKGEKIYGILDANLIRDADGNPSHFFGTVTDITETKKLEKKMFLDEKMKAIGQLAGGIAHDFNNILSAVIGYADLSLNELSEENSVYDNLLNIKKAGERAKNLVKQILLFSRGSGNTKKNINLASIIREAADLLKASIPSSINISLNCDNLSSSVFSDPTKMHEIIMNLCTNSAAALKGKGSICISVSEKYFATPFSGEAGITEKGLYNILTVKDDGPGIPYELKELIFEPFFTTKEVGSGTGMGLAVVFGIVKEHCGNIRVDSEPGHGAAFTIYLPAVKEKIKGEESPSSEISGGKEHILLVDDEEMICNMLKKMLENYGYKVNAFLKSIEAFEEFKNNSCRYDLLITDQTMPVLTGFELSQKILAINSNIPIILCTGYSTSVNEEKAFEAGIKGFLYKPVDKKDIVLKIREVLKS